MFFSYLIKCPLASYCFFTYDSHIMYRFFCIYCFLTVYIIHHMSQRHGFCSDHYVKHVVSSFICFHWDMFFLQVVVPTIVSSVQFLCVIYVNCIIYAICTCLIYLCFVFCFPSLLCILFDTTFYVFHVNFLMHMNMTDDHARAVHWYSYLSSCTDIHMHILIFHENYSLYCILLHIIYCNITSFLWHIYFQQ